ncbi:MAG: anti-sigma factor [Rhizobiaceae bacterium]|nr:anti-sigma factor [Rhizobiaceae bacterium]
MTRFSDETVMRYVDGELGDAESAEIESALETDRELAARVELFAGTRLSAKEALAPLLAEPVPATLKANVEAMVAAARDKPADSAPARADAVERPRLLSPANDWWRPAAAACVAGLLGVVVGFMASGRNESGGLEIAHVDRSALTQALRTIPMGQEEDLPGGDARFRAIASYYDNQNLLCREFELDLSAGQRVTSVTCNEEGEWRVRFAVNADAGEGYSPASSSEALEAYLSAVQAAEPLTAEEEAQALRKLR